jgi:hypothetical protein
MSDKDKTFTRKSIEEIKNERLKMSEKDFQRIEKDIKKAQEALKNMMCEAGFSEKQTKVLLLVLDSVYKNMAVSFSDITKYIDSKFQ